MSLPYRFLLGLALLLVGACQPAPPPGSQPAASAAPAVPLVGTRWHLVRVQAEAVAADPRPDLRLAAADSGRVTGRGGCNRFSGTYALAGPAGLTFGPLLSTKMACPQLALEGRYFGALATVARYRISADTLRLYRPDAAAPVAVFSTR